MKKSKKLLMGILATICVLSFAFTAGFALFASSTSTPIPQKVIYSAGTSIDLFDLFEIEEGFIYTFKVGEKGKEAQPVHGRSYYASKSGEYTAHLEGIKGSSRRTGSADFTVSDTLPYMMISGNSIRMNYNSYIDIDRIVNEVKMFISSDTSVEYSIDRAVFYKNHYVSSGETILFEKGTPAGNGLYDGQNRLTFNKEGVYDFHLVATNAGGSAEGTFSVSVSENVSGYKVLGEVNYDQETKVATWAEQDGAAFYRVKIDYENVITDQMSIDLDEYLIPEANGFQDFDLVVIPLDENKKELKYQDEQGYNVKGMLIKEDVVIAPEGFGRIVLGETTKVDVQTGIATLIGAKANLNLSTQGLMAMDSGYLGWQGNYGLNTYVEFEFTGNNIPNVIFFADELNNELTYGGKTEDSEKNKGLMVISGIYGAYSTGANMLACGDTVAVFGPNRYDNGWSIVDGRWCGKSGVPAPVYLGGGYKNPIPSEYALLTQEGLKADTTGRTYRYVIGTYGVQSGSETKIYLDIRMYDVNNDAKPLFVLQQDTKLTTDDFTVNGGAFEGGNIIVIAPSKEESLISQIKVSEPFESKPLSVTEKGYTDNADGSFTLKGAYAANANSGTFRSDYETLGSVTGFKAYTNTNESGYGLGTYLDITFKGNNLPILTFFADETSGAIAEGVLSGKTGAGMLMINGLVNKEPTSPAYTDQLRIYGPLKYGAKTEDGSAYVYNRDNTNYYVSSTTTELSALKALSQDSLDANTDYRLIVGAISKNDGYIYWDIQFVDLTSNRLLVELEVKTTVTVSAMKQALGIAESDELKGYIIVTGAFKGVDGNGKALDTTCKVALSETRPSSGLTYSRYPESVSLKGAYPPNANSGSLLEANASLGCVTEHKTLLDEKDSIASYGLNTYIDISFIGNNLPIITFFANEDSGAIANGSANNGAGGTGAGMLMINGLINKDANSQPDSDRFKIYGPYKYGAKDSTNSYIYSRWDHKISSKNAGFEYLAALAQDNLAEDSNYRLIIGVIEQNENICFDMQLIKDNTLVFDKIVDSKVTVVEMKTALGLATGDNLAGYIIFNGGFKGIDSDKNALSTTFTINAVQTGKISLPNGTVTE